MHFHFGVKIGENSHDLEEKMTISAASSSFARGLPAVWDRSTQLKEKKEGKCRDLTRNSKADKINLVYHTN